MRVGRLSWPYIAFSAYAAASLLMLSDPRRTILPLPLAGKLQVSELVFAVAFIVWLASRAPGVSRVARLTGVPAGVWIVAHMVTAAFAVLPGPAWRETAAVVYLGMVLVCGAALLSDPARLKDFTRWWLAAVAAVVVLGLLGGLAATLTGVENFFVYRSRDLYLFGDEVFRIRSTLTPTTKLLGTLLILVLPLAFVLRRHGTARERRLMGWLVALMTVCEMLTYSRQVLEYLGLLLLLAWLERPRRRAALAGALAASYLLGFLGLTALSTWRITDGRITQTADQTQTRTDNHYYSTIPDVGVQTISARVEYVYDNYFILKRMAWKAFLERPLAGWGPDTWPAVLQWAIDQGHAPAKMWFESAQSEPFTIAAEMGTIGLAGWAVFWVLCLGPMRASSNHGFAGTLARYQALGCAATLLTSVHLDVMRFRFLWIAVALGLAAAVCARHEAQVSEPGP